MNPLERLPNPSPESERIVISCMMQDPANCIPVVIEQLGPDAFRGGGHRAIVEAILERFHQRQGCDLISMTQHMTDNGKLDSVGGAGALVEVSMASPTVMALPEHLAEVRRKWVLTRLWQTGYDAITLASTHQDEGNPDQLLDDVERAFYNLRATFQKQDEQLRHVKHYIELAIGQIDVAYKARGGTVGVPTGFNDIDRMTSGLKGGQLVILAARPAQGKSALAMNIMMNAARSGYGCALFSLEMSGQEMAERMICSEAGTSISVVRQGFLGKQSFPKIINSGSEIAGQTIYIDETPALSLYALRAKARRLKMQHGIGFIVIDYLQLMRCPSKRADSNRALEIADITGGLKQLAKELDLPILALSQLNREAERRGEPKLSDLRESGSIEQDADIVMLMHREVPGPKDDEETRQDKINAPTQVIVAKHRNGAVGEILLKFDGEITKFRDTTEQKYSNDTSKRQANYKKKWSANKED